MILNLDSCKYLAENPVTALRIRDRLLGMIGKKFEKGKMDAMIFFHCNCVHSCFMGIPLDLVLTDRESRVVALKENYRPWSLPFGCRRAVTVIELPVGAIAASETRLGHLLNINSLLSTEGMADMTAVSGTPPVICCKRGSE